VLEPKPDYELVKIINEVIKDSKVALPDLNDINRLAFELYNFLIGFPGGLEKNVPRAMESALKKGRHGLSKKDWDMLKNHLVRSLRAKVGERK
jgi:hypothetical protein